MNIPSEEVIRGLVYSHNRANTNTSEVHQANAAVNVLTDLLIQCGLVDREDFDARVAKEADELKRRYIEQGMAVAVQDFSESKYTFQGAAAIDCENRTHLCKVACCRLAIALSREDLKEGIVHWDLGQPYMIARDKRDGYCVHLDRGSCGCKIYEHRPIPCRGYDCRKDKRIWLDFENKVVNPLVDDPNWPHCIEAEDAVDESNRLNRSTRSEANSIRLGFSLRALQVPSLSLGN